ncbi:DnaB-like helicase N-terminal domain-containing protein [Corynebacterium sp. A21]|uniref:DnaB-like helicase N-terminal domain-containing protein n=1 Tax=Corynebacterium sp. A21 TaxID=3457318 RepID=UPI003FCF64BE
MHRDTEVKQDVEQAEIESVTSDMLLDAEALLLCGLMWAPVGSVGAVQIVEVLTADDFYNPPYGTIYRIIADRVVMNQPADAASLRSWVIEQGSDSPIQPRQATSLLLSLATLGTAPERLINYADQVLGASYRRGYFAMTQALTQAAETAPENKLFEIMVEHGRAQRSAWSRRHALRELRAAAASA